jgi:hypothetical protein
MRSISAALSFSPPLAITRLRNSADRSDFPPIETGDATDAGAGRPIAECRLTRGVIGIGGAERPLDEHHRAVAVEKLQPKIRGEISHDFVMATKPCDLVNAHSVRSFFAMSAASQVLFRLLIARKASASSKLLAGGRGSLSR